MSVVVEIHNTGYIATRSEIIALIEHTLAGRIGDWHVSIIGSYDNDNWEMKVKGPEGFERTYTLVGSAREHEPDVIRSIVMRLLPTSAQKPSIS
jgi:hypothetical protein